MKWRTACTSAVVGRFRASLTRTRASLVSPRTSSSSTPLAPAAARWHSLALPQSADGIYLHDIATSALSRVADTSTQVPGLAENFVGFGDDSTGGLDLDGGSIAFIGQFGEGRVGDSGIYVFDSVTGAIVRIADSTMEIPGDVGIFRDAFTVGIDRRRPHRVRLWAGGQFTTDSADSPDSVLRGLHRSRWVAGISAAGRRHARRKSRPPRIRRSGGSRRKSDRHVGRVSPTVQKASTSPRCVPEPANLVLLLAGCGLLAFAANRRIKNNRRALEDVAYA